MYYYGCQVRTELVLREPKAWQLRPENIVMSTSFYHMADMTIIVGSAVAVLQVQLYMTEFILVTLPD
jgi:hypothetical protein